MAAGQPFDSIGDMNAPLPCRLPRRSIGIAALVLALLASAAGARAEPPEVRAGVLTFGTVNWELDVLKHHGLDLKHGYELRVIGLGGKDSTAVAL